VWMMCVCVIKLNWMKNGWMDWIEWMWKVDGCGKWKVARFRISHTSNVHVR